MPSLVMVLPNWQLLQPCTLPLPAGTLSYQHTLIQYILVT
jgi:hypothetical protein